MSIVAEYIGSLGTENSRRSMLSTLRTVAAELGAADPDAVAWCDLRANDIEELRGRLSVRCAPATVNKALAAVRGVSRIALRADVVAYAGIAAVKDVARRPVRPPSRVSDVAEVTMLAAACDTSPIGVRDAAVFAIIRTAHLRAGALAALTIGDRDMPDLSHARAEIGAWVKVRGVDDGPLFCAINKSGRPSLVPMVERSISYIVSRAAERAGVGKVTPAAIRRGSVATGQETVAALLTERASLREQLIAVGVIEAATSEEPF